MELSNTAYVILGALHERPRSGYDIKSFADNATRHFWAVSYGQLYPELKKLLDSSLIEAEDQPTGSRPRTVYHITRLGTEALADWVSDTTARACELRDEMLVRLFFSDATDRQSRIDLARAMAARHRSLVGGLCAKQDIARRPDEAPMHQEVLRFGIDVHEFMAGWYEQLAGRLEGSDD